jgi:hypothetical protein
VPTRIPASERTSQKLDALLTQGVAEGDAHRAARAGGPQDPWRKRWRRRWPRLRDAARAPDTGEEFLDRWVLGSLFEVS